MGGTRQSIGNGNRPDEVIGASPGQFYQIAGEIKLTGQGRTIGLPIEIPKNKEQVDFPSPDKYNPHLASTARNIINYRGHRSEIRELALDKNPSPDMYDKKVLSTSQTVSFTK
jgi:hypothetical protein